MNQSYIFENLFILELANNHWGSLKRAKQIVREFAHIVKQNKVKAAIKLQFRDVTVLFIKTSEMKELELILFVYQKEVDIFKRLQKLSCHAMKCENLLSISRNTIVFLWQLLLMRNRLKCVLI